MELADYPTDWLVLSGGDQTQTDGLERLKRVTVGRATESRVEQIEGGIPIAFEQAAMANENRHKIGQNGHLGPAEIRVQ